MIREMTEQDIPRMIELGARMHLESEYKDFKHNTQKTYTLGHTIIDSNDMCGFVSEVDGEIKGMFVGAKWEHYFSDATISGDLLLYVDPDHRGGMTGIRLIKAYLSWAKDLGVDDIRLGETAGIDRGAIAKLYAKLGFINYGTIYKLNR